MGLLKITGWDGQAAKTDLFTWGTCPKNDKILSRKMLEKYFGKVSGDGKKREDYSYPLAKVVNGKPKYDRDGLLAAFSAAKGSHTGEIDNSVADKVAKILKDVFGEDEMTEGTEEQIKENAYLMPDLKVVDKLDGIVNEISWDDVKAKTDLIKWATDADGHITKKNLMKWFLDVDGGDAQSPENYRYPVGSILAGSSPSYDPKGIDHSWDLAAGKKTGVANRMVQKKIIFIKQREKLPLTEEQGEFVQRHMASGELVKTYKNELRSASIYKENESVFYVKTNSGKTFTTDSNYLAINFAYEFAKSGIETGTGIKMNERIVDDEDSPGGINITEGLEDSIRYNSVSTGKVLDETDDYIDVPVIPMREGVFIGTDGIPTLKRYEVFSKDAHWLEGQPILHGHTGPTEIVTYKHNRRGKLINVTLRPENREVSAIARYYKNKISQSDLELIRSGQPYEGSIAYTCETIPEEGVWNGQKYNAVESTGYHFYHFAEVSEGACSVAKGCGFNMNSVPTVNESKSLDSVEMEGLKENSSCNKYNNGDINMAKEDGTEEVLIVDDDGNECSESELVDGKCPVKAAEETVPAEEKMNSSGERTVSVEVKIPEEFTMKMNSVMSENETLKSQIVSLTEVVNGLVQKQNETLDAQRKAEEKRDFDAFTQRLNQAAKADAEKHYESFKEQGWAYFDANPKILKGSVPVQKLNGVPAFENNSDLVAEKEKLRATLREKRKA
jgi:hypothetical protein